MHKTTRYNMRARNAVTYYGQIVRHEYDGPYIGIDPELELKAIESLLDYIQWLDRRIQKLEKQHAG